MKKTRVLFAAGLLAVCIQANAHEGAGFSIEADGYGCSISDEQIKKLPDREKWFDLFPEITEGENLLKADVVFSICLSLAMSLGN